MIIAVNASGLIKDQHGEYTNFIKEVFKNIASFHSNHSFIYIFDHPYSRALFFPENVIPVPLRLGAKTDIKNYIWGNLRIPKILKKYGAEIFVTPAICALTTVPQCLVLHDVSFLRTPAFTNKKKGFFYKKLMPIFLKRAKSVVVFSEYSKTLINTTYKISHGKTEVAHVAGNDLYKPVDFEEKEKIKDKYTNGFEYFLCTFKVPGSNDLVDLLKAFSAFKKRQKSNMRLIIIIKSTSEDETFNTSFRLFRFKEDVKFLRGLDQPEISKITGSSYGVIYRSSSEDTGSSLLNAMKCEVPILANSTGASPEICGDAALYVDTQSFEDLALKMMEIFKDEKLRKSLIEKGKLQARKFTWEDSGKRFWNILEQVIKSNDK